MKKKYISSNLYTAFDWHDMATNVVQLRNGESFVFDEPEEYIANKIFQELSSKLPDITEEMIKNIMSSGENKTFEVIIGKKEDYVNELSIEIYGSNPYGYHIEYESGFTVIQSYRVYEVEDEDLCYLVSEHIVNPGKGCNLLEHCYHELFDNYEEAEEYRTYMGSLVEPWHRTGSGFKLAVCSRTEMENHAWYKANLKATYCINQMGGAWQEYRFYNAHGVQCKYYEWLMENTSEEEKEKLDREIYLKVKDFLPLEEKEIYNNLVSQIKTRAKLQTIVDTVILRCFALCKCSEEYDRFRDSLDIYRGRTEEIGNEIMRNAPEGYKYFVVSNKGEIKYYDYLPKEKVSWWGVKKPFQLIEHAADCMRSFSGHDLFVEEFPVV